MSKFPHFYQQFLGLQKKLAAAGVDTFEYTKMLEWSGDRHARNKMIEAIRCQDIPGAEALVLAVAEETSRLKSKP